MLTHTGTRDIHTARLIIRRLRETDAEAMFRNYTSDPEVTKYLTWPAHTSVEITRNYVNYVISQYEKPDSYDWGIEFEGELIGVIGAVDVNTADEYCEIGYCIGRKWWGMGIMTEALRAVIDFLFTVPGFNCIDARHDVYNIGSRRVMEKSGMREDGTLRARKKFSDGTFHDVTYHSILRTEYKA